MAQTPDALDSPLELFYATNTIQLAPMVEVLKTVLNSSPWRTLNNIEYNVFGEYMLHISWTAAFAPR